MPVQQSHYEELLAEYSNHLGAIALMQQYRPYLEMVPSMRRPAESVITIPLPVVRIRNLTPQEAPSGNRLGTGGLICLPCDVAILMCDPEWKIKTGVEIFVFIHRPEEDFSDLLSRWRQTQVYLDRGYEWMMPRRYAHILSEGTDDIYPLFVVFADTPERIKRGLKGACLPFVVQSVSSASDEATSESLPTESENAEACD